MAEFPTHPDAVTPDWLGHVLGRAVAGIEWKPIGTGQVGDSVRFTIAFKGQTETGTFAAKFPAADSTSRGTAAMFGLYRKEVEFYRQAAPHLQVRVPQVHFVDVSEDGADFLLLFEDLGPARQGDQIASCGLDDAKAAIRQAAAIHAPSWGRVELLEADWLQPPLGQAERIAQMYPQAQAIFRERYRDTLDPAMMTLCDELAAQSERYFTRHDPPQCLVHGDFRLDNMLFDVRGGQEPIAVLDWQTTAIGQGMTDVAYLLGCGLGEAMWRTHEDELLDLYLLEMAALGVELSRAQTRRDYRLGALHGVSTAVFSAAFVERTTRGDANFLSMARGACSLALEHDSIAALKGDN
ncbi:hypothetical protein A9995_12905 [Erythrobacter sp. QSSC1-22B]|uniref:phosphotransferase family protein n=1 Tax=Erythrobacter sp. QSSC1-22B TaxID=1860125 RepID=UPI000805266D|nr:aminoglycoside phosphotransferase family protein [Erythrobacter sp. QSSC1-22B]OBX18365.1 hypothetical protein A9995_12905 [Erythrobacter sp. QSSC1-22B]